MRSLVISIVLSLSSAMFCMLYLYVEANRTVVSRTEESKLDIPEKSQKNLNIGVDATDDDGTSLTSPDICCAHK